MRMAVVIYFGVPVVNSDFFLLTENCVLPLVTEQEKIATGIGNNLKLLPGM